VAHSTLSPVRLALPIVAKQTVGTSPRMTSSDAQASSQLRLPFVLAGLVAFATAGLLFVDVDRRDGNIVAMCGSVALMTAGELIRGIMTLTNIRGYRVVLPVYIVATLSAFVVVAVNTPGAGKGRVFVRSHSCLEP
jgi:hypothetical protein